MIRDESGCSCNNYETPEWEREWSIGWNTREEVIREFNNWNGFESPMNKTRELERLIQVLNKPMVVYPSQSLAQTLRNTLGDPP